MRLFVVDLICMDNIGGHSEKVDILGLQVDKLSMAEALEIFEELLESEKTSIIVTLNSEMAARANKRFTEILEAADLVLPDGIGIVKASKILGTPLFERITGIDFTYAALKRVSELGVSAYFLGSRPGVAEKAAARLMKEMPGLRIAGCRDGYFNEDEEDELVQEINSSGAGFLCVALGSPKQEDFIYRHREDLKARVAIGIGGSLDVWSGEASRAPDFFLDRNIEWLYRLLRQPSRIKRIYRLPLFLIKVYAYRSRNEY